MRDSFKLRSVALLAAALVSGCGGGGGSSGTPANAAGTAAGSTSGTGAGTTAPAAVVASDLILSVDKAALANSGAEVSTLTVTAVDAARNAVAGAPVSVAVDGNAVFTPTSGTAVTGTDGKFSGTIAIGSDKSDRLLRYKVTSGSITKTGTVSVAGSVLSLGTVPNVVQPSQATVFSATVKDSAGNGIAGIAVNASGVPNTTLAPGVTNASGVATFRFNAPASDGNYPISVDASGVSGTYALRVTTPGSTAIPNAVSAVRAASLIATPVVVGANTSGSTANQSEIRALFLTDANVPLANVRVRFRIVSSALPGESLTMGSTVVYSDASGYAKTGYVAPTTSSPNSGVVIRACYALNDDPVTDCLNADATTEPAQSVKTALTATANPVALTIGSDNVIEKSASGISYVKKFEIQAVNAAGNYAANVPLSAVVDIQGYWKGPTMVPSLASREIQDIYDSTGKLAYKWCPNEDINRNGVLEINQGVSEDTNKDGFLTPRQSDVAIGFVNSNRTDANGLATLQLQYPQNTATWLRVKITVTAGVSGSEGAATYVYHLTPAKVDVDAGNGAFLMPLYGRTLDCTVKD
jgi:hypothetical protein